ncbi:hypothetical protein pneo_cds_704 [Pandoravirus neocaledonia]|uniref:Uncharacterized protein n=1 Tax=Pandoravirus neocaledonia TaxID=2107708 RepID=A0A2U7UCX4_9VIRU|nr:hypothetical protein pneo_cds_704 [Pandoravirus neocaledonia]AVK76311.1 hypothetical protein pneo_cds_704 [Pandoravirus neocaledonia]
MNSGCAHAMAQRVARNASFNACVRATWTAAIAREQTDAPTRSRSVLDGDGLLALLGVNTRGAPAHIESTRATHPRR